MASEVALGNIMVDCDDEKKLQRFYGELLGWEMCELFARPAVRSASGTVFLFCEDSILFMSKVNGSCGNSRLRTVKQEIPWLRQWVIHGKGEERINGRP